MEILYIITVASVAIILFITALFLIVFLGYLLYEFVRGLL